MTQRIRAETTYRARRTRKGEVRARVPFAVRDALGAKPGDKLIFEQGCDRAVALAALKGTYFVVTLERAKVEPAAIVVEAAEETPEPAILESFAETVRKRLNADA